MKKSAEIPRYMKPTASFEGRVNGSSDSGGKKSRRGLIKNPNLDDVKRATCSSTLKDRKFPSFLNLNPGGTESDGVSVVKVCPYAYCSLNGAYCRDSSSSSLPSIKCFLSAKRKMMIESQKGVVKPEDFVDELFVELNCEVSSGLEKSSMAEIESGVNCRELMVHSKDESDELFDEKGVAILSPADCVLELSDSIRSCVAVEVENIVQFQSSELNSEGSNLEQSSMAKVELLNESEDEFDDRRDAFFSQDDSSLGLSDSIKGSVSVEDENIVQVQSFELSSEASGFEKSSISKTKSDVEECKDGGVNHDELVFKSDEECIISNNEKVAASSSQDQCSAEEMKLSSEEQASLAQVKADLFDEDVISNGEDDNKSITETQPEEAIVEFQSLESSSEASDSEQSSMGNMESDKPVHKTDAFSSQDDADSLDEDHSSTATKNRQIPMNDDSDYSRLFNPKEPNFLPLEPDKESEKVDLRHQELDDRKNSEEWMVDYALRQVVTKLRPARRKKVELLVEAFEQVMPTTNITLQNATPIQACR